MNKVKSWFRALSTIGKASVVTAVLTGGFVTAAAMTPSTPPTDSPVVAPVVTTKTETTTTPIAFEKQTLNDPNVEVGTTFVQTGGQDGVSTVTHTMTLTDGVETSRTSSEPVTTTAPIVEVTVVGTKPKPQPKVPSNCNSNYSGCVPNASDVDCASGSGNGPAYVAGPVYVTGYDVYGLDRDGDGVGCE